jgi:hypothetical protein
MSKKESPQFSIQSSMGRFAKPLLLVTTILFAPADAVRQYGKWCAGHIHNTSLANSRRIPGSG